MVFLRGLGAGLNNLHLECIRLFGFIFPYFILVATHVGLFLTIWTGTDSYQGRGNGVQVLGIWVDGGNLHAKRWRLVIHDFYFIFPLSIVPML